MAICLNCKRIFTPKNGTVGKYCNRECYHASGNGVADLSVRFWKRVNKDGPIVRPELGNCWMWTGILKHDGYGLLSTGKYGPQIRAHRYSWELHYGPIPEGKLACHKCDNRACVRPDHLFLGTDNDNIRDMIKKNRRGYTGSPGEKHPLAKLTDHQVNFIKQLSPYRKRGTGVKLANLFHVSECQISAIFCGREWTHVKP